MTALHADEVIRRIKENIEQARAIDEMAVTGRDAGAAILRKRRFLRAASGYCQRFTSFGRKPPGCTIALQREAVMLSEEIERLWPVPRSVREAQEKRTKKSAENGIREETAND
jgi:hypothetical protein